ncbi:Hsp70 protein-domain-containing protein [Crassisporium funariophilum]|nr:Hsp70 protein-domain-containing protein [Crassisporium funariophilum]
MAPKAVPNGSAEAPLELSKLPPVVGINFGNSYASIAEGLAESIANEDGERQIACAIAFHGEEMYIGNQAKQQLVKNSKNTIMGFRNLLGKKFSEIPQSQPTTSASVIQHPDISDEPAYRVEILQPAPKPLPPSNVTSAYTTPAASHAPTPRSEPTPAERVLSVSEVTTIFIKSLVQSAEDFLGKKIEGAVISVPADFTDAQRNALEKAATDAGVNVLQLLDEAGAAAATTTTDLWSTELQQDRTQLVIDVGASSLSLSLLSVREGLTYILASSHSSKVGGDQIDDKLIKFFATDFVKKSKTPLAVCPSTDIADKRAEAKLRLAIEHTKRTISASPGAATCSVESLKDGMDYTGSINRMRFDMVVSTVYAAVAEGVAALLADAGVDSHDVDEIVYVGGTTCLPGLDERLCLSGGFREDVETPFARGTVVGGGVGDPTTILARGCAAQAALIESINKSEAELREAFSRETKANQVKATTRTLGVLFPNDSDKEVGGTWIPVVQKETALPVRRIVSFDAEVTESSKRIAFEIWEVKEGIRIEKVIPDKQDSDDDDEEEEDEIEVKHRTLSKEVLLGALEAQAKLDIQTKGKGKDKGKWFTRLEVQFVIGIDGDLAVDVKEVGDGGATAQLRVPAP